MDEINVFGPCEHGRNCIQCPEKRLYEARSFMHKACQILEDVHRSFDGITVNRIASWAGDCEIILNRKP